jgi:hypothetical protein
VKSLSDEEEKSLTTFDFNEFVYPYKRVNGNYGHLTSLKERDSVDSLLDMIMMFLNTSLRPHHIEAEISRNFHAFGKEGLFAKDLEILENWC